MVVFNFPDLVHQCMVLAVHLWLILMVYVANSTFCAADLFQRLFRQDLLVASLFRNFLLAERIMRSANCSPISHPMLPPTHQHHMWYTDPFKFNLVVCLSNSIFTFNFAHCRDAWDMAAEICLAQLPTLMDDPMAEFQVCSLGFSYIYLNYSGLTRFVRI